MKNPLLMYFLIFSFRLYSQDHLAYNYGVSYPGGIYSGINFSRDDFSSLFQFNYRNETFQLDQFYFKSDYLSLGPVSFSGLLKDMSTDDIHPFSVDEIPAMEINSSGNPGSNMGLIFEMTKIDAGLSVIRQEDLARLLIWKNIFLSGDGMINLSQSLSVDEENDDDVGSWYTDEPILNSLLQLNSMLTIVIGRDELFGGGQLQINTSTSDPPGYSILLLGGIVKGGIFFQNDLRYSSPGFVTSDLYPYKYPLLLIGGINFLELSFEWDNNYYFYVERENLPWDNSLWELAIESIFEYETGLWTFNGEIDLSFYSSESEKILLALNLACSAKRDVGRFYWQMQGEAGYDIYFLYSLSLKAGYETSLLTIDLSSSVDIERSITADISLNGVLSFKRSKIRAEFTLEDLGFYNSDDISLKPYFFIGLQLESLINPSS